MKLEKVSFTYSPNTAYEIHALKNINLEIRDGEFIGLIGHTGSGKSTLVGEVLNKTLLGKLNHARTRPGSCKCIEGIEHLDKVIDIDQSPIGRTPRPFQQSSLRLLQRLHGS